MSKQEHAPGQLELVRRFVNTLDLEQASEQFSDPAGLERWLREQGLLADGLRAERGDLARARELREALRVILLAHTSGEAAPPEATQTLERAAGRARIRLHFDTPGVARLAPEASG